MIQRRGAEGMPGKVQKSFTTEYTESNECTES